MTQDKKHVLAILVDNEAGVLGRVVGLFSGRGYNIESLTVSETDHDRSLSRITVVTLCDDQVIDKIIAQIQRLIPVNKVVNLTAAGPVVQRELALFKVVSKDEKRMEALRLADAFRASVIDATPTSFILELIGKPGKIDSFTALMLPLGLEEVVRTGLVAMGRGAKPLQDVNPKTDDKTS